MHSKLLSIPHTPTHKWKTITRKVSLFVLALSDLEQGRVQLLGQVEERFWILAKVADLKHGLGGGQVVFLEVVVQASSRAAEIRYACSWGGE